MNAPTTHVVRASLGLALLASAGWAQDGSSLQRGPKDAFGPVQHATYDLTTGHLERDAMPTKSALDTYCYVNTDILPAFLAPGEMNSETLIDWGLMGGTAATGCAGVSDIVSNVEFLYATSSPDTSIGAGAELTLTFYTDYSGFGVDSGNSPVATFAFTGLPGLSGSTTGGAAQIFAVDFDLTGGFEFCLPTGEIAVGFASPEASLAGDGFANTGPVLCSVPTLPGVDTATGQVDAVDSWSPNTFGSATTFTVAPGSSSFDIAIARADLSGMPASTTFRNGGTNPSTYAASPVVLGGTFTATVDNASAGQLTSGIFGLDAMVSLTLGAGQTLLCLDTIGSGELWTGSGLLPTVGGPIDTYVVPIPKRLDLCGFAFSTQAVMVGSPPFELTNAQDVVVGG